MRFWEFVDALDSDYVQQLAATGSIRIRELLRVRTMLERMVPDFREEPLLANGRPLHDPGCVPFPCVLMQRSIGGTLFIDFAKGSENGPAFDPGSYDEWFNDGRLSLQEVVDCLDGFTSGCLPHQQGYYRIYCDRLDLLRMWARRDDRIVMVNGKPITSIKELPRKCVLSRKTVGGRTVWCFDYSLNSADDFVIDDFDVEASAL